MISNLRFAIPIVFHIRTDAVLYHAPWQVFFFLSGAFTESRDNESLASALTSIAHIARMYVFTESRYSASAVSIQVQPSKVIPGVSIPPLT